MPKQIWINLGEPSEYQPYFVGGRYNATLRLFRRDGSRIPRVDSESIRQDVLSQYPGKVRVSVKSVRVAKASPGQVLAAMDALGHGPEKFTALADLGRRLGGSPEAIHTAVLQLWRAGRITVAAAEGRSGSTPEERRWWMESQGETLGYVMLRKDALKRRR